MKWNPRWDKLKWAERPVLPGDTPKELPTVMLGKIAIPIGLISQKWAERPQLPDIEKENKMNQKTVELEKALADLRINGMPVPEAFSWVGKIQRGGLQQGELVAEWPDYSLEKRIGLAACLLGGPVHAPGPAQIVTYAHEQLCRGTFNVNMSDDKLDERQQNLYRALAGNFPGQGTEKFVKAIQSATLANPDENNVVKDVVGIYKEMLGCSQDEAFKHATAQLPPIGSGNVLGSILGDLPKNVVYVGHPDQLSPMK